MSSQRKPTLIPVKKRLPNPDISPLPGFNLIHHFQRPEEWNERVVYIGVGVHVKDVTSLDQQLPGLFKQFYSQEQNGVHAKAFLFDPEFRRNTPLFIQHENEQTPGAWEILDFNLFRRGRLLVYISNAWLDFQSTFYTQIESYIERILESEGAVFLGVFTQPYTRVEENNDIVLLYNKILDRHLPKQNLQYYHLADYGKRTEKKETLVWYLHGKPHNQDIAVVKEASYYPGEGLNFGVSVYPQYPGKLFTFGDPETGLVDYQSLQKQVSLAVVNQKEHLHEDECYVSELPFQFNFYE